MTLEQEFNQHLHERGYWDHHRQFVQCNSTQAWTLAWTNPNTTIAPETMFQIIWLLTSSRRRYRLTPTEIRILEQTAMDIVCDRVLLNPSRHYIEELWQRLYQEEYSAA